MGRLVLSSLMVLLLSMTCTQAVEPVTAPSSVSSAVESVASDSQGGWLSRAKKGLNPSQTCPHCRQEFSADRSLWMLLVGFIGQIFFTSRFLVQWLASERRKESYIPHIFWHLSIVGSVMLLAYAISIMAWPIILGQAFGVIVYGRNLALIARKKNRDAAETQNTEASDR